VWADTLQPGRVYAGRLSLGEDGLGLDGGRGSDLYQRQIGCEEITGFRRTTGVGGVGGRSSLRVELRSGEALLVSTVFGSTALSEISERLLALLA
jgi:hypothetical protein